ncbi:uncharacterized protein LOC134279522 isoform X2 [Saccostrea cucullata]|uniref:uncharacterized protein LOC134279522 isoform X2 n=1 Tax=Saccostrea cuccullata TaxID=36930 RepID=UPI002ED05A2B
MKRARGTLKCRKDSRTKTENKAVEDVDATSGKSLEEQGNAPKASTMSKTSISDIGQNNAGLALKAHLSEEDVRGILRDVHISVSRRRTAIDQIITKEQANELADAFMESFEKRAKFTKRFYLDGRREPQEILYKAAEENLKELIIRTTSNPSTFEGKPLFLLKHPMCQLRTPQLDKRMCSRMRQLRAEKLEMQQDLYDTASEIIRDLCQCADTNIRLNSYKELEDFFSKEKGDPKPTKKGWRKYFCRVHATKQQQKKKNSRWLIRLRRLFSRPQC